MATYKELLTSFDLSLSSSNLSLPKYPANFFPDPTPDEFLIYEIIPSKKGEKEYGDTNYKAGMFIAQIYVQANQGPLRVYEVADELEELIVRKVFSSTQTYDPVLFMVGVDRDDKSLFRADFSLQFNSF